jgi:NADH:ubiquinone oxidoreductase subunit D
MNEMSESINIINQVISKITLINNKNLKKTKNTNISPHNILKFLLKKNESQNLNKNNYNSMENLINHFKY